jgi:TIR domain
VDRPIFLSYRRSDSASATGRLYDAIGRRFGTDTVYMDTSSMAWGEEWPRALERAVKAARVMIVVIGPSWLQASDQWGRRRIDQPDDWVRREIELALSGDKAILPLLVGGANMPPGEALPSELAGLADRTARPVRETSWTDDVEGILSSLATHVASEAREGEPERGSAGAEIDELEDELVRTRAAGAQFRSIATRFYSDPIEGRMAAAEEIAGIGGLLPVDAVLEFANSGSPAERVAAAIAIGAHLRMSEQPRADPRVQSALRTLLNDHRRSRVRYRAVEVLAGFPALAADYGRDLNWLAENDPNADVRRMARRARR